MAVVFSKPTYPVVHHAPPVSLAVSNFRVSDWALVLGATALSYPIGYHLIGTLLASASLSLSRALFGPLQAILTRVYVVFVGPTAKPPIPRRVGGWAALIVGAVGYEPLPYTTSHPL